MVIRRRVHFGCNCAWIFFSLFLKIREKQNKVTLFGDLQSKRASAKAKKGCYICRSVVEHQMVPLVLLLPLFYYFWYSCNPSKSKKGCLLPSLESIYIYPKEQQ